MPGAHRRIGPLQGQGARTRRSARRLALERGDARAQRAQERFGLRAVTRRVAQERNRCQDVVERSGLERNDARTPTTLGMTRTQLFRRALHDVVRDGADVAELLRDDEVGREIFEQRRIEVIEARPSVNGGADVTIDCGGIAQLGARRGRKPRQARRLRRIIALVGDAHDFIAGADRKQNLRGTREQANDAHGLLESYSPCASE
ncbi:MAG: hypothetical protein WBE83_04350 [Candidatus Cybelea sp.]